MFVEWKHQYTNESMSESDFKQWAGGRPGCLCHIIAFETKTVLGTLSYQFKVDLEPL